MMTMKVREVLLEFRITDFYFVFLKHFIFLCHWLDEEEEEEEEEGEDDDDE